MTGNCEDNQVDIKDGWWDKNNLHIINAEGEHIVLINCEVIEYVSPGECEDGIGYFDFKASGRMQLLK